MAIQQVTTNHQTQKENPYHVITIEATAPETEIKLRVAAYIRVSSDSSDQLNSFSAQNKHYTSLISGKENWSMVDIYADEGIIGTSIEKRDEFKRMISDCRHGKIDRILVKSISRFARNTKECLQTIRELKSIGVSIYFEKENIDTAEEQLTSYEAQKNYYTDYIMKNKSWSLVDIFADEGITGTSARKRPEFLRMIRMCKWKKIDIVLTKSISRFARNTVDCLNYIRILKEHTMYLNSPDYTEMYSMLDQAIAGNLTQIEMYLMIGQAVCSREEKGAAIAAAKYLQANYPDMRGFSPRNLRRMREFYRTYAQDMELLPQRNFGKWFCFFGG